MKYKPYDTLLVNKIKYHVCHINSDYKAYELHKTDNYQDFMWITEEELDKKEVKLIRRLLEDNK